MKGLPYGTLLAAAVLAGCSSVKTYPDVRPRNVHVHAETSSASPLSKVRAALHVHRVDANCVTEYEGSVRLEQPSVELGLPAGRTSLVAVTFSSSSFLGGSSSTARYATLLTPRSGHQYDVKVSYREDIYEVTIRETDPRRSSSRELTRRDPTACKAS